MTTATAARRYLPRTALATLSLVLFLTFLDTTMVSVVLANVQNDLHTGVIGLQWVVNGYALVFASLMLTFGTLGDVFGRKKIMLGGVAVFCAGSVIGAVAPDVQVLIAGRVVMGLGAAASEPGTLSMIRHIYPDRQERARALGVWAAVSGLGLALGPVIGGALAGVWSWRAVFWFNLFFGLVALVLAAWVLPESSDPTKRRVDLPGFLLSAIALAAASVAVIAGETAGYASGWIDALFALALVATVGFIVFERRAANPVLNVGYFKRPAFAGSNFVAFSIYFSTFAIFFFVALYLEEVGTSSPYTVAVDFVPMAVGLVLTGWLAGRWVAARGPRLPMFCGCVLAGAGVLLTDARLTPNSGLASIGWTMALAGIGFGMAIVPVTTSALAVIPPENSGMAASMTNTSRVLGAVAGVAVLGSVVNGQLTVDLVRRLTAIGVPKAFQSEVITAVTTGTFSQQAAAAAGGNKSFEQIVNRVVTAAFGAFANGLDIALMMAASLMFVSALVALACLRVRPTPLAEQD
ncbi:MAG TPA: MFS transporter [Acidimicrobiales bacterium]|nr:MFS transporter [Acidimicrobiales bacterium]